MKHPTEHQEGIALARWLRAREIAFVHVPNEAARSDAHGRRLRDAGVERGCPDYLVFTPPPARPDVRGIAIELKRRRPASATVSPAQRAWLARLEACGWIAVIARGAHEAVTLLRDLGFDSKGGEV